MRLPIAMLLGGCWLAFAACDRGSVTTSKTCETNCTPAVLPNGTAIADVAARVMPSVVNVVSEHAPPKSADPVVDFLLEGRQLRSLGSGVIISRDGVILTSNHVIENGTKIRVALQDERELDAEIIGSDPQSDVAVLRVKANNLRAIDIADSSKLRVGDLVLAVGNPFGIGQTVTMGIVSAMGRGDMGLTDYGDFIQTDAAINPGNSGGALVDMQGRLVGINSAIVSRSGGYLGIAFAIPSNMAMQVKDVILTKGTVSHGWLGIGTQNLTPELAQMLDLTPHKGVVVAAVTKDGPGARAGLVPGDVILAIDGIPTNTSTQLRNVVGLDGKGKRVRLDIQRGGTVHHVELVLEEQPAEPPQPANG
jgi:Do/DeqQ family serine protease